MNLTNLLFYASGGITWGFSPFRQVWVPQPGSCTLTNQMANQSIDFEHPVGNDPVQGGTVAVFISGGNGADLLALTHAGDTLAQVAWPHGVPRITRPSH